MIGFFKKFFKRIFIAVMLIAIASAAYVIATNIYVYSTTRERISLPCDVVSSEEKFDCILILGAGLRPDGSPSAMLAERLEAGLELYKSGASGKIIVSGDHGTTQYDEVNAMKGWLVEKGVPSDDVFMDHAGFSTYDSIYRARAIFMADKICIVSQKYHLYRALYLADHLSLDACGADAQKVVYNGWELREIREIAARSKDFVCGVFKPKPRYLGKIIPVFGDGNQTNDKTEGDTPNY